METCKCGGKLVLLRIFNSEFKGQKGYLCTNCLYCQPRSKKMTKIKWKNQLQKPTFYFNDVPENQHFRINSPQSQGAVYRKVYCGRSDIVVKQRYHHTEHEYLMMEEETGKLFLPTQSPVVLVEVEVSINEVKPSIY